MSTVSKLFAANVSFILPERISQLVNAQPILLIYNKCLKRHFTI